MIPDAGSRPDEAVLAYELMIGNVLADVGAAESGLARAWAEFWLDDPDADAPCRLAARLEDAGLPLAAVARVHGLLVALELPHLAEAGAEALAAWIEAANERLVGLLSAMENARAGVAPAGASEEVVAALAEAAGILNGSLERLRAVAAPRQAA
ncbi:MAG TPA: hypothetical protein VEA41_09630 [Salinarimonas sp.]|nr:hypothetical protein [Salinarimonas sp.]